MVLAFCSATGIAPGRIMVVGDTDRDMGMARAAGAGLAVGVLSGATPHDRLVATADCVVSDIFAIEGIWTELSDRLRRAQTGKNEENRG